MTNARFNVKRNILRAALPCLVVAWLGLVWHYMHATVEPSHMYPALQRKSFLLMVKSRMNIVRLYRYRYMHSNEDLLNVERSDACIKFFKRQK